MENFFININGVFFTCLLLLGFLSNIAVIVLLIYIFFSYLGRPIKPRTLYNFWVDRFYPSILLITPFYSAIFHPSFFKMKESVILEIFCSLLLFIWTRHSNWFLNNKPWNNSYFLFRFSIGLLYTYIWTLSLCFLVKYRAGLSCTIVILDLGSIIQNILICVFFWPYITIWLRLFIGSLLKLRHYLWNQFLTLIIMIHIYLLQFNSYFKFMRILYKISDHCVIYLRNTTDIHNRYKYRFIFFIILSVLTCFDIVTTEVDLGILYPLKGIGFVLFYSLYFVFSIFLMKPFISGMINLSQGTQEEGTLISLNFMDMVCISDYHFNTSAKPRYPTYYESNLKDIKKKAMKFTLKAHFLGKNL